MAVGHLLKAVATPGTAVSLSATNLFVSWFMVQVGKTAGGANTGAIYIGGPGVGNGSSGTFGLKIAQTATAPIPFVPTGAVNPYNLANFWINADTAADGASVIYDEA